MWGAARWLTNGGSSGQTDAAKTPARTASDGESGLAAETSSAITSGGMTGGPEAGRANGHAAAQHEGAVGSHESPGGEASEKELRAQLRSVQLERDALLKDVEALCMQGDVGTIFDKSSLLSERIIAADRELSVVRAQLAAVVDERNGLREDLRGVRESKLVADRSWRTEREKTTQLERELAFYQAQSATAMSDRDSAAWEAEELRGQNLVLEQACAAAQATAESEASAKSDALNALNDARQRIEELTRQVKGLDVIPGLRRDLEASVRNIEELHGERDAFKGNLAEVTRKLESTSSELRASTEECSSLQGRLEEANDIVAERGAAVTGLETQLAAAVERADAAEDSLEEARLEVAELKRVNDVQGKALKNARSELEQATQQKVAALLQLSDAQMSGGRAEDRAERAGRLVDSLRAQLEQARRELAKLAPEVPAGQDDAGKASQAGAADKTQRYPNTGGRAYWKTWLPGGGGHAPGEPQAGRIDHDADAASTPGVSDGPDVHAYRREEQQREPQRQVSCAQIAILQERLRQVEKAAQQAHRLRTALVDAAAVIQRSDAASEAASALDQLTEEARTMRVGVVLGLSPSPSKAVPEDEEDESAAAPGKDVGDAGKPATAKSPAQRRVESSEDDEDFFSMSTPGSRGAGAASGGRSAAATGPQATVARELLDLIEFSITALRRQVSLADTAGRELERSPSNVSKRSNSGAVRIGDSAAASAASSPGTAAQQAGSSGRGASGLLKSLSARRSVDSAKTT